jgi:hypothetical protein
MKVELLLAIGFNSLADPEMIQPKYKYCYGVLKALVLLVKEILQNPSLNSWI